MEEMAKFYRTINVMLDAPPEIPSLPIYEAAACGKPTIICGSSVTTKTGEQTK